MDLQIQLRQPAGRDGRLFLQGHLARPNPQIADFDGEAEALAMFAGPHAYISPSWYETGPAVPTRNYASVHAYGPAQRIDDPEWLRGVEAVSKPRLLN
jgi:transcriptional regulator